jgi:glycosyltransferase involved in cell wall biosynthesis
LACNTPVLISDTPALAEIAGPAALRVDPRSVGSIAAGLERLLTDGPLRERLRAAGAARAAALSWERAARETLAVYREVLGQPVPAYLPATDAA